METVFSLFITIGVLLNSGHYATKQFKAPEPFETFAACEEYMKGDVFLADLTETQEWVANHEKVDVMKNTTTKCREVPNVK